ncbi:hypothetical protein M8J76_008783 [Diaphorina citri]|nr:hypothetical protein M8J76_008783 [Diaphorina citri]
MPSDVKLSEGLLLGLGNPLLDISATVDASFLEKYNLKANNAILADEKHKDLYEDLIKNNKVDYIAGGSTQNTLRVAQWLIEKPKVAVFMGAVGKDNYSDILESKASEFGLVVKYQHHDTEPTGTCAVLITDNGKARSLVANLAAANLFTPDHLQVPENNKLIQNAEYYYVSGFFLTVSPESILEVAKVALAKNRLFLMNLSAPFICEIFNKQQMQMMPYVDILFGNETEALAFAKQQNFQTEDLHAIALKISNLPKQNPNRERITIITQGDKPIILSQNGKTTEFPVQRLPAESVVDTNGAGDSFVGGFLSQLIKGEPLSVCIECGVWAAQHIIQVSGCTLVGKPSFKPSSSNYS